MRSTQRPLMAAGMVLLILASTVLAACGDDGAGAGAGGDKTPAPASYYLALGDSIAFGLQPDEADASPQAFDTGYVDVFAARLRKATPNLRVVNYGCPGETTATFIRGGCPWLAEGEQLHDAFEGSQLEAAQAFLRAHPKQVSPITLTLWGNDLFPLSARRKRAPSAIAAVASRLKSILERLRAAAPTAEIIVTGAWNPEADQLKQVEPLYRSLDAAIAQAAAASRARVANIFDAFNPPGSVGMQRARVCALTYFCSKGGDVHPTDAGYRAMADAFAAASASGS